MSERIQLPESTSELGRAAARAAVATYRAAIGALERHPAPAMGVRFALEDGETVADYGGEDGAPLCLVCPWCGSDVRREGGVIEVDTSERENGGVAEEDAGGGGTVWFHQDDGDYRTLYLRTSCCDLPVSLPEGWEANW